MEGDSLKKLDAIITKGHKLLKNISIDEVKYKIWNYRAIELIESNFKTEKTILTIISNNRSFRDINAGLDTSTYSWANCRIYLEEDIDYLTAILENQRENLQTTEEPKIPIKNLNTIDKKIKEKSNAIAGNEMKSYSVTQWINYLIVLIFGLLFIADILYLVFNCTLNLLSLLLPIGASLITISLRFLELAKKNLSLFEWFNILLIGLKEGDRKSIISSIFILIACLILAFAAGYFYKNFNPRSNNTNVDSQSLENNSPIVEDTTSPITNESPPAFTPTPSPIDQEYFENIVITYWNSMDEGNYNISWAMLSDVGLSYFPDGKDEFEKYFRENFKSFGVNPESFNNYFHENNSEYAEISFSLSMTLINQIYPYLEKHRACFSLNQDGIWKVDIYKVIREPYSQCEND